MDVTMDVTDEGGVRGIKGSVFIEKNGLDYGVSYRPRIKRLSKSARLNSNQVGRP